MVIQVKWRVSNKRCTNMLVVIPYIHCWNETDRMAGWGLKLLCKFQATKNSAIDSYTVLIEFHIMHYSCSFCKVYRNWVLHDVHLDSTWFHTTVLRPSLYHDYTCIWVRLTACITLPLFYFILLDYILMPLHMQYLTLLNPSSLYQKSLSFMQHNSMIWCVMLLCSKYCQK